MADIELIIKIPEEMYKWVNDVNKIFDDYGTSDFIDLVKKGTPLDKIRAEIEQIKEAEYQIYGKGSWRFIDKCLDIIDKYKAESEDRG